MGAGTAVADAAIFDQFAPISLGNTRATIAIAPSVAATWRAPRTRAVSRRAAALPGPRLRPGTLRVIGAGQGDQTQHATNPGARGMQLS